MRKERAYNVEHKIWPRVNYRIDRMLERGAELNSVYEDLCRKLEPKAVERFLSIIHDVGAVWDPVRLSAAREAYRRQDALKSEIFELAKMLARRLGERTDLSEFSGFRTNNTFHIVDLIELASESNGLFGSHLREPLSALSHQYDLKYWPSVEDVLDAIAEDALNVDIKPTNAIIEAGTRSPKQSKADSFRALQGVLEENRRSFHSPIGADFHLSDESWATILNVILDHNPDELVDGSYIKRLRQRDREVTRDELNVD